MPKKNIYIAVSLNFIRARGSDRRIIQHSIIMKALHQFLLEGYLITELQYCYRVYNHTELQYSLTILVTDYLGELTPINII